MSDARPNPKPDSKKDEALAQDDERPTCPKCGSQNVRRSSTQGIVPYLLRVLGRWPFRCRSCRARFFRPVPPLDDD